MRALSQSLLAYRRCRTCPVRHPGVTIWWPIYIFRGFFGTAIQCETARRFPRSVVKVRLNVQCKNISISSGGSTLNLDWFKIIIFQYIICEILKRGIGKTRCKPMRNLAKIQMSPKHGLPPPHNWVFFSFFF